MSKPAFCDMGALACAIESAAVDGVVHEVEYSLARYDALMAAGVPVADGDALIVARVRVWLGLL
jgi:hypothetical protein